MGKTKKNSDKAAASKSQTEPKAKRKPQQKNSAMFDEDWDSDEEVQLNFDDIFGGDDDASDGDPETPPKVKINRHLATFHEDIGLSPEEVRLLKESRQIGAGKGSGSQCGSGKSGGSSVSAVERPRSESPDVIVFQDPTRRHKRAVVEKSTVLPRAQKNVFNKHTDKDTNGMDLKVARQEVLRFGIRGLEQRDKQAATLEMLVRLGAKAPKRTCIGYKQYMENKKAEKERLRNSKSSNQLFDHGKLEAIQSFSLYKKRLNKNKKDKGPVDGIPTGRHGVQKIKDKDVKKMGQSKHVRRSDVKKRPFKAR